MGNYAAAVGTRRGHQTEAELGNSPSVVLYSEKGLLLKAPGVRETRCLNADATYRFRYDGLKLVLQSGEQYFFLPAGWSRPSGNALLIPRSDALRLEFVLTGAGTSVASGSC